MDIVFLTDELARGGAETQMTRIAATLKRRGWSVGVISLLPSLAFTGELERAGVPLYDCSKAAKRFPQLPFVLTLRLILQLRRWHPAVLITFNFYGDILGRICGRMAGVKAIVATQGTAHVKTPLRQWVYRCTEKFIDLTISNSQAGLAYMVSRKLLTPRKTATIYNGIVLSSFPALGSRAEARAEFAFPPGAFVWLAVGNLRPAKDYPTLLAAAEQCAAAHSNWFLLIAGEGEQEALLAEADRRGLTGRVLFLGPRTDVPRLLRACDAFVLSSAWEGMPNTVMEAMASGVPVVSTDAGGVRELLSQGVQGDIVPIRDPGALAERMLHMMRLGEEERLRMGAQGRQRIAQDFDNERVVDGWEAMIRRVIAAAGKPQESRGRANPRAPALLANASPTSKVPLSGGGEGGGTEG